MTADEIKKSMLAKASSFQRDVQQKLSNLSNDNLFPNDPFAVKLGRKPVVNSNPVNQPVAATNYNYNSTVSGNNFQQQPAAARPMTMAEKIAALRGAGNSSFANMHRHKTF